MSITQEELYKVLQLIGAADAAKLGYFHDLPGGGGEVGSSALMIEAQVVQDADSPPGTGFLDYTYVEPRVSPSFIDVLILDPSSLLIYNTKIMSNTGSSFRVRFSTLWFDPVAEGDVPAFKQRIAIRAEEFVPTVTM
ncbi:hypothetical protein [Pseudomonas phage vB_PseuGesM_254]|uniref:Uncharacterized protein n=1 Tax=Pseudomonas phage vB_PseuGesM_254 TaxID=3092638 RepID=A0AAX4G688_9CAUD|nr:hypothetical protein [Pseudomonas phage PseuGes_254]